MTAKQKPRMVRDMRQRTQKNSFHGGVRSSSLEWIGLPASFATSDLNEVGSMQETGKFDGHSNVEREEREVVVDVVEHAVRSIDLRGKLTNHGRVEDHGQPGHQEDLRDNFRKSPELSTC